MIKVSILYPYEEGKTFDMDYYCSSHMPMVQRLLGDACKKVEVEQGLAGTIPGSPPTYLAMGHIFFDNLEELTSSLSKHSNTFMADVPNFTNATLVGQISEVKM